MTDIVESLRSGRQWLNGGECCGQLDDSGTCAAPACIFGDALKYMFKAADEIEHLRRIIDTVHPQMQARIDRLESELAEAIERGNDWCDQAQKARSERDAARREGEIASFEAGARSMRSAMEESARRAAPAEEKRIRVLLEDGR